MLQNKKQIEETEKALVLPEHKRKKQEEQL